MTLLERLKELSATTGRRNGNEDLGHWADREKHENTWVRDEALPALIAVAEADIELNRLIAQNDKLLGGSKITQVAIRKKWDERDAALAALEVEV